ncbi:MAG: hypothetical protein H7062_13985, partial [Candidatus Saccharimonas sp.]|nr:hypothetical protein [Planctomycetaceae bacterium]
MPGLLSHRLIVAGVCGGVLGTTSLFAGDWTQFRGSSGTAVASTNEKLP